MPSRTPRYGIVASRFNRPITESLVAGALSVFKAHRVPPARVDVVRVAGAFELSVAALRMALSGRYRAVVAVGCILEGETPHFAYLSQATLTGLTLAGVLSGVPVTCGVITAKDWKQALARSQRKGLNRGREAAAAAWDLAQALEKLDER